MEAAVVENTSPGGLAPGLVSADTGSVPDLPSTPAGKPTEAQIIESFNQPSKEEVAQTEGKVETQPEVKEEVNEKVEVKPQEEEEEVPLTEEDLSVAKIQQFAKDLPELKQAFDKNPQLRNTVFAMARRSARLGEYQQTFQTVEAAKFAAENSENFMQMNDMFFSEDRQGAIDFWNQLHENSLLKDPNTGEVVIDQRTGSPVSTGAYERVAAAYREALWINAEQLIASYPQPDKAKEALAIIQDLVGDKRLPSQQQQPQFTPEQQKLLQEAEQIKRQSSQDQTTRVQEFRQSVGVAIVDTIKQDISENVKRMVETQGIALTPYEQKKVVSDIFDEIDSLAQANRQYTIHFESLLKRAPLTEAGKKSLIAEARKFSKEVQASATLKVIREATSGKEEKSAAQKAKRVEQQSRKEVKTVGGVPSPSSQDIRSKARAMQAQLKRPLTEDEIIALS